MWTRAHSKGSPGVGLSDVIQTKDGGYIMLGISLYTDTNFPTHHGSFTDRDIWVMKLDSLGNKQWSKVFGGTGEDIPKKILEPSAGNYYVIGATTSSDFDCTGHHGGYGDGYVLKLNDTGGIIWHRDYGGTDNEGFGYACLSSNGGGSIIVAGSTFSNNGDVHHHINNMNFWVAEIDSLGNIKWENCYGGGGNEDIKSICQATDGSIWMAGTSGVDSGGEVYTSFGHGDAFFVHADSAGNFLSSKVLGSTSNSLQDEGWMIHPLANGSVIAGGFYSKNDGAFTDLPSFSSTLYSDAFIAVFPSWTSDIQPIRENNNSVYVYPNPAKEVLFLTSKGRREITIFDGAGRKKYEDSVTGEKSIPVNNWNRGVYYLKATDNKGNTQALTFLLN